jgi:hypothetical protein
MVDDLLTVSQCGNKTISMNITINTLRNKKSKCHSLHIGKQNGNCPPMKVHGHVTDRVSEAVYLGHILSADGKNTHNIRSRVSKGMGIVTKIMDILKTVSFGSNYFEIAITLRESQLINGMLTNAEVWYGLLKSEVNELEEVDRLLLRRILELPNSSCIESLYLELGLCPISVILKARRIGYLHYLVNLQNNEMLKSFFKVQWQFPVKNDWVEQVKEDLKDFGIQPDLEKIQAKSTWSFKNLLKIKMKEHALEKLNGMTGSKIHNNTHRAQK